MSYKHKSKTKCDSCKNFSDVNCCNAVGRFLDTFSEKDVESIYCNSFVKKNGTKK